MQWRAPIERPFERRSSSVTEPPTSAEWRTAQPPESPRQLCASPTCLRWRFSRSAWQSAPTASESVPASPARSCASDAGGIPLCAAAAPRPLYPRSIDVSVVLAARPRAIARARRQPPMQQRRRLRWRSGAFVPSASRRLSTLYPHAAMKLWHMSSSRSPLPVRSGVSGKGSSRPSAATGCSLTYWSVRRWRTKLRCSPLARATIPVSPSGLSERSSTSRRAGLGGTESTSIAVADDPGDGGGGAAAAAAEPAAADVAAARAGEAAAAPAPAAAPAAGSATSWRSAPTASAPTWSMRLCERSSVFSDG